MNENIAYLDNNATTRVAPEVIEAMLPYMGDRYGNPSSMYRFGGTVKRDVERAREEVAALICAEPDEIVFTSCGTEADNMALKGFYALHKNQTRMITSSVEHPAVRNTARYLKNEGAYLVELPVNEFGMLRFDDLGFGTAQTDDDKNRRGVACNALTSDTSDTADTAPVNVTTMLDGQFIDPHTIVSLMWANNETGVVFPIDLIAGRVKELGGTMHTDAVQAAGKIKINVREIPVDTLAISGHKLHAPKGIGATFIRRGVKIPPLIHGGHQEHNLRGGTENVPYIIGLGKACELAMKNMNAENTKVRAMRDRLEKTLLEKCKGAKLNGHPTERLPNTTNISFENIEGEAILLHLDEHGIAASSGSACTTGSLEPSHVMMAMGIPYNYAHSSIRFSLSVYNKEEDIDRVIEVMPGIVEKLRALSPFV